MAGTQGKYYKKGDTKKPDMIERGRTKQHAKADWELLKNEWVMTNISLADLAKKYDVPFFQVRNHYCRERWMDDLAEFNGMVEEAIAEAKKQKAKMLASRVVDLDEMVLATSERVMEVVAEQIEKSINKDKDRITAKDIIGVMKAASETIKNAHYNIRLSGDKATAIVDSRTEILNPEDEERIKDEFDFITRKNRNISKEQLSKETPSPSVDSDKSS